MQVVTIPVEVKFSIQREDEFVEIPLGLGEWAKASDVHPLHAFWSTYECGCTNFCSRENDGSRWPQKFCGEHGKPEARRVAVLEGYVVFEDGADHYRLVRHIEYWQQRPVGRFEDGLFLSLPPRPEAKPCP